MTVRRVLVYGDPRLEAPNLPVEDFGPELERLLEDMFESAWAAPGVGIAAPQIGVNLRLAVVDLSVGKDPARRMVLANPRIVSAERCATVEEGCLSFPDLFVSISRPRQVVVRAQDRTGEWCEVEASDLLAQAICHEVDHLDGVLLVHHLRGLKRRLFVRRVRRLRELGAWGPA